jgi:hypothetical protein
VPALLLAGACTARKASPSYVPVLANPSPAPPAARGTLLGDYQWAAAAPTLQEAAARWEKFLASHAPPNGDYEDNFQKLHVETATLELMRVYYLLGKNTQADALLKQLDPSRPH